MNLIRDLWRDERGNANLASVILLTTIIGLGVVVGLTTMRDHIVQQFGDVAISIDALDQSFSTSNMGSFTDPGAVTDTANTEPGGLYVRLPASNE